MPAITLREVKAAYALGCRVNDGSMNEAEAAKQLVTDYGMDRGSAIGYIRQVGFFLTGKTYTRTINDTATRYYLTKIKTDFSPTKLALALSALASHIEYYERISGAKRPSLRKIYEEFRENEILTLEEVLNQFEIEVFNSLLLSEERRRKFLPSKGNKPIKKTILSQIYIRNPHVVAAAHLRARGSCENCMKPAPFLRKSDGKPYLEVHHKVMLAAGGDDTLENVLALCPNCHRRDHLG